MLSEVFSLASNSNAISCKNYNREQWIINLHTLWTLPRALLKFLDGLYFEFLTQFLCQGKT